MSIMDWMEHLDAPLWTGQTVHGESVLFVEGADGIRSARLLFAPAGILRVASASGETTYREGVDFRLAGNTLGMNDNLQLSVWLELMRRKRFLDLTGNGVNHPNDFAHRLYAQVILAIMGRP